MLLKLLMILSILKYFTVFQSLYHHYTAWPAIYHRAPAWNSFWQLHKVWKSNSISLALKRFDSLILSILLYGCQTWTIIRRMENLINSFATSCYRVIQNIRRIDRVTNETVLRQMNCSPLIQTVKVKQLTTTPQHWMRAIHLPILRYALYPSHASVDPP